MELVMCGLFVTLCWTVEHGLRLTRTCMTEIFKDIMFAICYRYARNIQGCKLALVGKTMTLLYNGSVNYCPVCKFTIELSDVIVVNTAHLQLFFIITKLNVICS